MTVTTGNAGNELLSPADAARVQEALDNSIADATKTAYASDWRSFTQWCGTSGYRAMPATAETVIAYLTFMASAVRTDGKHAYAQSTIVRRAPSINAQHIAAGMAPPGSDGRIARALKAIKRSRTQPPRRVAPLLTGDIRLLLERTAVRTWLDGVGAVRDAALRRLPVDGPARCSGRSGRAGRDDACPAQRRAADLAYLQGRQAPSPPG